MILNKFYAVIVWIMKGDKCMKGVYYIFVSVGADVFLAEVLDMVHSDWNRDVHDLVAGGKADAEEESGRIHDTCGAEMDELYEVDDTA